MGNAQTASTLTLVAGILQIIFSLIFIVIGVIFMGLLGGYLWRSLSDPYYTLLIGPLMLLPLILFSVFGVIGLIFGVIWLNWRHYPSKHKTGLIASGILALIFSVGYVPGILALVAGAIAPSPSDYHGFETVKTPTKRKGMQCHRCGADIISEDRFCWRCGTEL